MTPPLTRDEVIAFLEGRGWERDETVTRPWWVPGCVAYMRNTWMVVVVPDGLADTDRRNAEAVAFALDADQMGLREVVAFYVRAELAKAGER